MSPLSVLLLSIGIAIMWIVIDITFFRKLYKKTEQESHNEMISMQKNYTIHIFLFVCGIVLVFYGLISLNGEVDRSMRIIQIGIGLLLIAGSIVGLFTRKKIIEMHTQSLAKPDPELYSLQKGTSVAIFVLLVGSSYVFKAYNLPFITGFIIAAFAVILPSLYYVYKSKQIKSRVTPSQGPDNLIK